MCGVVDLLLTYGALGVPIFIYGQEAATTFDRRANYGTHSCESVNFVLLDLGGRTCIKTNSAQIQSCEKESFE